LSDQAFDIVRERILEGSIPNNVPIRQDALAAELGVSKIPLREALARLEQEGLLDSQPNRGFFVRPMTEAELEEVYALRLKLEPDAVIAGSLAATDAQREVAKKALATFKLEADASSISGGSHNRAFHIAMIAPSGHRVTNDFLSKLHILADRYVCKHLEPLGRDARADREHDEMLAAWLERDVEAMRSLTHDHIFSTLADLRVQFANEV
jgi:DNA-binding GntR family transcriptional regulator